MNLHKPFFFFLLILFYNNFAHASGGTSWGKITETYVHQGWTMVKVNGVTENPDNCASVIYYALHPSQESYEYLHSTLLSAMISNRRVRFWVDGCKGQHNHYPNIRSVFVSAN